ncbi:MAG: EAL domain-containing protein [Nitrospiria bacterium]
MEKEQDKETVLVVEDDWFVAGLEKKSLEQSGYHILTAETTHEAMNWIMKQKIDLIVLDNILSDGDTGLKFYAQLKEKGILIPVIIVTGLSDEGTIINALRAGVKDFVTKSSKYLEYLPEAVERVLIQERMGKTLIRSQNDLKKSASLLRATIEATADGLLVVNSSGKITSFNQRFVQMWGLPQEIVNSKDDQRAIHFVLKQLKDPKKFAEKIKELYAQPLTQSFDVLEFKDGRVYERVSRPQILDGQPVGRVWSFRDITERIKAEERLSYLAHRDALTGLPNRTLMHDRLNQAMTQAQRSGTWVGVLFLDLDRFKAINDTLGHQIGDLLLKSVAERLMKCVRESDTVARLGGDEFAILLTNLKQSHHAAKVAQKVIETLSQPFLLGGPELFVTASVGITLYPSDEKSIEGLLKNADTAMYRAKENGRNNYQFYTGEMNTAALNRLSLENSLRLALQRNEFTVHYQPQVNLKTGQIDGVEALLRWNHPHLGNVAPSRFIPIAEETGLIVPIGEWVLRTACSQSKIWQSAGHPPIKMSINISARQLKHHYFIQLVQGILKENRLDPEFLNLELTESVIMQNVEGTIALLKHLTNMGVTFSIDDFGTGYSSLSYLKKFPVHILKVDPSFVREVATSPTDASIVISIITLAHNLKLTVIAEGVETPSQLEFLREQNCDGIQGYLFSPSLPAEELGQLLTSQRNPLFKFKLRS